MPRIHEEAKCPGKRGGPEPVGVWVRVRSRGWAVMGWTWRLCVRPGVEVGTGAGRLRWHVSIACDCERLFTAVSRL